MTLSLTPLQNFPMIRQGDNLADIILKGMQSNSIALQNEDVLVIAQKIVSKSEGRLVNLSLVTPSKKAQELAQQTNKDARVVELILRESNAILRTKTGVIICEHKLGFVCANAGIDQSNIFPHEPSDGLKPSRRLNKEEWALLLPKNPDQSAHRLRKKLNASTGTKVGILIIDSHGRAWREGTIGITIGLSGIPGIVDLRGKPDLSNLPLQTTIVGVADELAAGASLMMGQAAEATPVIHVRGFPYEPRESSIKELIRPKKEDLFR